MRQSLAAVALSLACAVSAVDAAAGDPPRPHILFFLADDFGYYNVGFRNPLEKTPVIDAAAKDSANLERHYVSCC
jgi:arylsulfatase B